MPWSLAINVYRKTVKTGPMWDHLATSSGDEAPPKASTFSSKQKDTPIPEVAQVPRAPPSHRVGSTMALCCRCCGCGHLPSACPSALLSLAGLEAETGIGHPQITAAYLNDPNMKRDEHGLWRDTGARLVATNVSWKTATFCRNCGESGHEEGNCPKIPFRMMARTMKNCFEWDSKVSSSEIKEFFWDLWE
jgi:hypothetical protein